MKAHDKDAELSKRFKYPHFKPGQSMSMARSTINLSAPPTMSPTDYECYIQAILKQGPRDYVNF